MSSPTVQHRDPHEQRDIHRRGTLLFAAGFLALIVGSVSVLWLVFGSREPGFSAARTLGSIPNDTELLQRDRLAAYRASQSAELDRLGWTDATHQSARLPIADAMRLLAAKGAAR